MGHRPIQVALPFLDIHINKKTNGQLTTFIYRKSTHTNQYLNFESYHHLQHKRSVVHSLTHRANTIISDQDENLLELENIQEVFTVNNYRKWMMNIPPKKKKTPHQPNNTNQLSRRPPRVIILYVRGVSEKLQSVYKKI